MQAKRGTMCSPSQAAASWTQAKKSKHDADALDTALLEHDGILIQALQIQRGASLAPKPDPTIPLKPSKLFGRPASNQANAMRPLRCAPQFPSRKSESGRSGPRSLRMCLAVPQPQIRILLELAPAVLQLQIRILLEWPQTVMQPRVCRRNQCHNLQDQPLWPLKNQAQKITQSCKTLRR